jgi:hypothetical protein
VREGLAFLIYIYIYICEVTTLEGLKVKLMMKMQIHRVSFSFGFVISHCR